MNMRMASGALVHMEANFGADDHSSDPWYVWTAYYTPTPTMQHAASLYVRKLTKFSPRRMACDV